MSEYKNPLSRERTFTVCDDQVKIKTTMEDFFGALMQDHPTREECREMISEILQQYVNYDDPDFKYIMGYVREIV